MTDFSLLPMIQRRMAEAMARREPFPSEEGALIRRLTATGAIWRRCACSRFESGGSARP